MGCYMKCSVCEEKKHNDSFDYLNGKDALYEYSDTDRVCDTCFDEGIELLRQSKREED